MVAEVKGKKHRLKKSLKLSKLIKGGFNHYELEVPAIHLI
jgi:hypothetical protein